MEERDKGNQRTRKSKLEIVEYYVILIGDDPYLAEREVIYALESAGFYYNFLGRNGLILFIRSFEGIAPYLAWRCAKVRYVVRLFFKGTLEEIKEIEKLDIKLEGSFAVRIHSYDKDFKKITNDLEREIGRIFYLKGNRVDLESPSVLILGYIKDRILYLGFLEAKSDRKALLSRRPSKRPAFHPSSMMPENSRLMVNLAKSPLNGLFVDPFCGVGGILIEAALISEHCVGIDIDANMIKGCKENVRYYHLYNVDLVRGDATKLPLRRVESIACDTPYGIASSLKGRSHADLLREFLEGIKSYGKMRICIATVEEKLEPLGYKIVLKHPQRVRKSLIRWLYVLELDDGSNTPRNSGEQAHKAERPSFYSY